MLSKYRCEWLALAAALLAIAGCDDHDARADIVVYGGHVPELRAKNSPFVNPFTSRDLATDPLTTSVLRDISSDGAGGTLRNPRGTASWNVAALGKYVFLGNYDHRASSWGQTIEDQRIGLYDSENKTFCQLDIDPAVNANASAAYLAVARPNARKSRVFYQGIEWGVGYSVGFFTADLDNPKPCDRTTGWLAQAADTQYNAAQLNQLADPPNPDFPDPCPNNHCGFDGIVHLHHDAATNTDTIMLNNWFHRLVIADVTRIRVGDTEKDQLSIRAVHDTPTIRRPNNACYLAYPVAQASVDRTRPRSDLRFLQASETACKPPGDPSCPTTSICPFDTGAVCSGTCAQRYCSIKHGDAYVKAPAAGAVCGGQPATCQHYPVGGGLCANLGSATNACLPNHHPDTKCEVKPVSPDRAVCTCGKAPQVLQEFRYNGETRTLQATSRYFQSTNAENMDRFDGSFATTGDVFLMGSAKQPDKSYQVRIARYARDQAGNHSYNEPGPVDPADGTLVFREPTAAYPYDVGNNEFGFAFYPGSIREAGNSMYLLSKKNVQRLTYGFGTWSMDPTYKVALGMDNGSGASGPLPQESHVCHDKVLTSCDANKPCPGTHECVDNAYCRPRPSWGCLVNSDCPDPGTQRCSEMSCREPAFSKHPNSGKPCTANAECPSGETCEPEIGGGEVAPTGSALGGTPGSLWTAVHQTRGAADYAHLNAYLNRIPLSLPVPGDNKTSVPPALAWSTRAHAGQQPCASGKCDRLWLFGAQSGVLRYRTRDQSLWTTSWRNLPQNVALAGGLAATFTATNIDRTDGAVELFGRARSDGRLYWSKLTSALDCTPGATCQWANWQLVPNAPVTDVEPAATMAWPDGSPLVFVAVKDRSGKLWVNQRSPSGWGTWREVPGLLTNASPALVFKTDASRSDGEAWLFARDSQSHAMKYARVDTTAPGTWATAGGAGAQAWVTAPAAAFTGRVRLLASYGSGLDIQTYQTTFDGNAWDDWKPIFTRAGSSVRPAAAVVNGDLNVITTYLSNMSEQLVK